MLYISKITQKFSALFAFIIAALTVSGRGEKTTISGSFKSKPMMLKINSRFMKLTFFAILSVIMSFSDSCGEDPVRPSEPSDEIEVLDSSIFEWSFIPVPAFDFYDTYIADTNAIFYIGDGKVYLCDGINSVRIYDNINGSAYTIDGSGNEQIFIGGYKQGSLNSTPFLKKWNGAIFEDILLPADSNNAVWNICVESATSVWFAGLNGRIYHYDGVNVTSYRIAIPTTFPKFFKKDNSEYYYTETNTPNVVAYVYKFDGSQWQHVSTDSSSPPLSWSGMGLLEPGSHILRKTPKYIEEFNGSNWNRVLRTSGFETYSAAGENLTDLLTNGIEEGTTYFRPFYYNGSKWFRDTGQYYPETEFWSFPIEMKYCKGIYFGFYYAITLISHNYILVGRKIITPPVK